MIDPRTTTTRRTALGGALAGAVAGVGALGGCSLDGLGGDDEPSAVTTPTAPPADADATLVEDVRDALAEAHARVRAARKRFPTLSRELAPLDRLHRTHAEDLGGLGETSIADGRTNAARARTQVLAAEQQLQRRLAAASVRAESGSLAQVLAQMSASVAQHRTVLR